MRLRIPVSFVYSFSLFYIFSLYFRFPFVVINKHTLQSSVCNWTDAFTIKLCAISFRFAWIFFIFRKSVDTNMPDCLLMCKCYVLGILINLIKFAHVKNRVALNTCVFEIETNSFMQRKLYLEIFEIWVASVICDRKFEYNRCPSLAVIIWITKFCLSNSVKIRLISSSEPSKKT